MSAAEVEEVVSAIPDAHYLKSLVKQNLSMRTALCEWIDNAIDAGATNVIVSFGKARKSGAEYVSVKDNGRGKEDLLPFVVLGRHDRTKTTRSGINGCGAKDASLWIGGAESVFTIVSVCGGKRRTLVVDWDSMARNKWQLRIPTAQDAGLDPTGTKVLVAPVVRNVPVKKDWIKLIDELAYTYTPAIKRGIQITVQSKSEGSTVLSAWKLPPLQPGHVDTVINVNGRRARVYVGVVVDGQANPRPGITYLHGFRVISKASTDGCGSYSVTRVAGFVEIDDSWERNKNKDGIQDADELYDAVLAVIESLLKRVEQRRSELQFAAFDRAVEGIINAGLDDAKAKRGRGDSSGTVHPKGTGKRHRNASKKQPGSTMPSNRFQSIKIDYDGLEDGVVGRVQGNGVVVLNSNNAAIASARRSNNVPAVAMAVVSLIASDLAILGENSNVPIRGMTSREEDLSTLESFTKWMGKLLSSSTNFDGQTIVADAAE